MKSDAKGDSLLMFIMGFAFGAGVALLAAPQSGKRTRREIARKVEDAQEYVTEAGEELVEKGRKAINRVQSLAEEKISAVRS